MYEDNLYTEDEIIIIGDKLKSLKGKIILDENNNFFILKDYNIKSVTIEEFRFFSSNKTVQRFYVDSITVSNEDEEFQLNERMCTVFGIKKLLKYHIKYNALEKKLMKFTKKNNINLNFGELCQIKD